MTNDVPALGWGMLVPGVAGRGPGPWGWGTCGGGWLVLGLRTAVKRSSTSFPSSSEKVWQLSVSVHVYEM